MSEIVFRINRTLPASISDVDPCPLQNCGALGPEKKLPEQIMEG